MEEHDDFFKGHWRSKDSWPGGPAVHLLFSLHPPRNGRHRHVLQSHAGRFILKGFTDV